MDATTPRPALGPVLRALLASALVAWPSASHAEPAVPVRTVETPRITLADLVPSAPAELAGVDLGPSPPAGSERVVRRSEIEDALPADPARPAMSIPTATRVVRASTKLDRGAIEALVRTSAAGKLPKGSSLRAVRPRGGAVVPRGYDAVDLLVPRPPRKVGRHAASAMLRFSREGVATATIAVPIDLDISAAALVPDARRGTEVEVVVASGAIEIRARGKANEDADVGDLLQVTVDGSGKVLRAKLVEAQPLRAVVEP